MLSRILRGSALVLTALLLVPISTAVFAAESRQIEEVVVTAERRESTVQDTAIAITAFTGDFIEDFGIRNQEDLQNYIPATTIQPYDLSIRGVGRLFRALGGDPGVATYFDGVYSEDFGIASTEGGLFDIERIEVLRGPQGTLYGRNGIGGAVNFHSKKPTDEFEGEIKTILGSYDTKEIYGVLSGPLIDGVLNARFTAVNRERDGFMEDLGGGPDINDYGDENYTLALEWTPMENLSVIVRGNERSYRRMMSGAQGAGSIIASEMGGLADPVTGGSRWVSVPVHGFRPIQDPNAPGATMCASATDRSTPDCIVPAGMVPYINGTNPWYAFTLNGATRYAQPLVAGVDAAGVAADGTTNSGFAGTNYAYQAFGDPGLTAIANRSISGNGLAIPELDGDDLETWTNGFNEEFFDHQAGYMNITWDVTDWLTLKYIGGYTDYFYDRTTEDDRTGLPIDQQFYAAQENENFQHEIQVFADIGEDITLTGGLFAYSNDIDQQLDFYSTDSWTKYTDGANYGAATADAYLFSDATVVTCATPPDCDAASPTAVRGATGTAGMVVYGGDAFGMANHRSAQDLALFNLHNVGVGIPSFDDPSISEVQFHDTPWRGDNPANTGSVDEGPLSDGTTFIWDTENRTDAWAVYLQGEWQINDIWALTLGVRYAEDDKEAEENLFLYQESPGGLQNCIVNTTVWMRDIDGIAQPDPVTGAPVASTAPADVLASGLGHAACGSTPLADLSDPAVQADVLAGNLALSDISDSQLTLAEYNQNITGAIDASGNVVDFDALRVRGIPYARSIYRELENDFDEVTWRVNVDWTPTEDDLYYFSVTTGYRAGGFNLGYFSFIPTYDPEELIAYEFGYKGRMLDGTLQLNVSAYLYDYDEVHLQFSTFSFTGVSTSVQNAPSAETIGFEVEAMWLVTDNLTLGGNYSYTKAEYNEELFEPVTGTTGVVDANNPYAPASLFTTAERNFPIDGEPLPRVPEHKATGWAEYAQNLGDNGSITYLTTLSWTDEFPAAGRPVPATPLVLAPDFLRWDARVSWKNATENWNVSAFVNNITDELGVRNQFDYGESEGHRRVIEPTNPRMWGVELQYKFGAF